MHEKSLKIQRGNQNP